MKSSAQSILKKLLSSYIALWLTWTVSSLALFLNQTTSYPTHYPVLDYFIKTLTAAGLILITTGSMLLVWRHEVYWTSQKRTSTLVLSILAVAITAISLFAQNITMLSLIAMLPPALILAWSPFHNTSEQRVQEHDFGVTIRLFNPTVARLMLSSMLWGPALFLSVIYYIGLTKDYWPELEFFPAIVCLIVAALWTGIWFRAVSWTRRRIVLTIISIAIAVIVELIQLSYTNKFSIKLDDFSRGGVGLGLFIILTTIFWQNTAAERRRNLTDAKLYQNFDATPYCPECGFNLTGLKKLRCPECGRQYTLAKLLYDNVKMRNLDMQLEME